MNKIRIPISISLLAGITISIYSMSNSELWSYQTLVLFLCSWLIILSIAYPKFSKLPRQIEYVGWSSLTGVLLCLAFPSLGFSPVLLFAWTPLLWVERKISKELEGINKWEVFKYAFNSLIIWNILTTYWVGNTSLFAGVFAILANSLLMTIPWILFHVIKNKHAKLAYASLVCFWLTFEFFHFRWDLAWPWLTLGNGFSSFHSLIQWYEFTGTLGGSLWILISNIFLFKLLEKIISGKEIRKSVIYTNLVVLVPMAISLFIYFNYHEKGDKINVVCLQANYEPHYEQANVSNTQVLNKCLEEFDTLVDTSTHYLIFPESTFGNISENDLERNEVFRIFSMMTTMEFPNLKIIAGATAYKKLNENSKDLPSTRMSIVVEDTTYYHVYNGAFQIGEGRIQNYKKSKLVIGPEFIPFSKTLAPFSDFISEMGGSLHGFAKDENRKVFTSKDAIAAPVICYEQNFGAYLRDYFIKNGANFIAIITNDGWWGNTAGYKQHLEFSRLRAIEYRRSIARAANTGSSCFVNEKGDISQATEYGISTAIKSEISLNNKITYYARTGDYIGRLAMFMSILFILNLIVKGRMEK